MCGRAFALAGDCAHGIHPIAGQGLNLGLKDAAAWRKPCWMRRVWGGISGRCDVLKRYERWRRFDSFALAASTDALNRLFSNDIAPLRQLRDLGLGIVDAIGPARRFFMRHAGGDIGKLPRLDEGRTGLALSCRPLPARSAGELSAAERGQRAPALGGAFARRQRRAFRARQGLRQFGIKAPGDGADAVGAGFFGVVAVREISVPRTDIARCRRS